MQVQRENQETTLPKFSEKIENQLKIENFTFSFLEASHKSSIKSLIESNSIEFQEEFFQNIIDQDQANQTSFYLNLLNEEKEIIAFCHYFFEKKFSRGGVIQMHICPILFNENILSNMMQNYYNVQKSSEIYNEYLRDAKKCIKQVLLKQAFQYKSDSYKLTIQTEQEFCHDLKEIGFEFNAEDIKKNDVFMTRYNTPQRKSQEVKAKL